jgi:hypothetical protein
MAGAVSFIEMATIGWLKGTGPSGNSWTLSNKAEIESRVFAPVAQNHSAIT